jgi:hypothetical protein
MGHAIVRGLRWINGEALVRHIRPSLQGTRAGYVPVLFTLFWSLLIWSLLAPPAAVWAQPGESPVRLGFLPLGSPSNVYDQSGVEAFRQGLREAGLVENRHVIVYLVWIANDSEYASAVNGFV